MLVDVVTVAQHAPRTRLHRETGFRDAVHQPLGLQPICHELCDGDERKTVLLREAIELRPARARSIFAQYLTDYPGRRESRETCEIHRRFGVPDALQYSAVARAERRNVSGTTEIGGNRFRIYGDLN